MRTPETPSSTSTVQSQLRALDPEAALFVRDLIRGLEAEAGTARALGVRAELRAARAQERSERVEERLAGLESALESAQQDAARLAAENEALRRQVEELEHLRTPADGRRRR